MPNSLAAISHMDDIYKIEKWIYTQENFDEMGWHDCLIYAIAFDDNVMLDIDYIFKWVNPVNNIGGYKFWISPATMVFKNPSEFNISIKTNFLNGLEIFEINRVLNNDKTKYTIQTQEGDIVIETNEFEQIIRKPPILQSSQSLSEIERGKTCFDLVPDKNFKPTQYVLDRRVLSNNLYELKNQLTSLEIIKDNPNHFTKSPKERIIQERILTNDIQTLKHKINELNIELEKKYGS